MAHRFPVSNTECNGPQQYPPSSVPPYFCQYFGPNSPVPDSRELLLPCHVTWRGNVEWIEKAKNPTDAQKQTRHVPCQVWVNSEDGDSRLKGDTWPSKLTMQFIPKQLMKNIGGSYLKIGKRIGFHPMGCAALVSLTKILNAGFVAVHLTSVPSSPVCEVKVVLLLYAAKERLYLGFIPDDQTAFIDRLREVIQQQKTFNAFMRQGQADPGPGNTIPAPMSTTGMQGGILMSQTNTMAMGGDQIMQNVVSMNAPPQTLTWTSGPQTQMNMQNSGISGPQANTGASGVIGQQQLPFDDIEMDRELLEIMRSIQLFDFQ